MGTKAWAVFTLDWPRKLPTRVLLVVGFQIVRGSRLYNKHTPYQELTGQTQGGLGERCCVMCLKTASSVIYVPTRARRWGKATAPSQAEVHLDSYVAR
jgi:hypothetical protein